MNSGVEGSPAARIDAGRRFANRRRMTLHASKADLCKAMTAGALAGLAASFVMTRFHVALSGRGVTGSENPQSNKPVDASGDDAAMETADLVAQSTTGQPLTRREKTEVG